MFFPITTSGRIRVTKVSARRSGRNQTELLSAIARTLEEVGARRLQLDGGTVSFSSPPLARRPTWSELGPISKGNVSVDIDRGDLIIRYKLTLSPVTAVGIIVCITSVAIWLHEPGTSKTPAAELSIISYLLILGTQVLIANAGVRRILLRSAGKSGFVESERE
jgi:hypothetical protein